MTLFMASSHKTFKPFVQMTNLSKVGEGHWQTFGNPCKSIILKDSTVPMVTPKGEKWNMPLTLQRLIDHISGATWFDITKFALKIKSSIFVLVNWKKKKIFNPIWPFLRYSQRKTDSFLSWTTHFYLYYRLLSSLSSGLIQEHWMVHDKSTRLPPKAGKLGNFICFTLRRERENFLRKIKDREDKRERSTWFPHSPCVWGRNKPKEIIRFPQSTAFFSWKRLPKSDSHRGLQKAGLALCFDLFLLT